jgi:hypothetical protein
MALLVGLLALTQSHVDFVDKCDRIHAQPFALHPETPMDDAEWWCQKECKLLKASEECEKISTNFPKRCGCDPIKVLTPEEERKATINQNDEEDDVMNKFMAKNEGLGKNANFLKAICNAGKYISKYKKQKHKKYEALQIGFDMPTGIPAECLYCPSGKFSVGTDNPLCFGCPPGKYQELAGKSKCVNKEGYEEEIVAESTPPPTPPPTPAPGESLS